MQIRIYFSFCLLLLMSSTATLYAQLTISGQVRTRTEYRNGQGTPSVRDTIPAVFTSQRTRINVGYTGYRFKLFTAIQDVRVWGQDASTINRTAAEINDGLILHEAWGEISLVDTGKVVKHFTLKIGRQEIVYDDVRLLGNLDWLQQARRHDAALLKFEHHGWTAHFGAAFNQNAERKSNTIYNGTPTGYAAGTNGIGNLYKSMQFLYVSKKLMSGTASMLLFKDDFSRFHFASNDVDKKTPIYERGARNRYTAGGNYFGTVFKKITVAASAFYQGGHYRDGNRLDEYLLSLSGLYAVNKNASVGPGVDVTSGNNGDDPAKRNQRFDPLYGTPHKFWGYMDYFYVADGFGSNGLIDLYLKSKMKMSDKVTCMLDVHRFSLPDAITGESGDHLGKTLGTEIDFTTQLVLTKSIHIEGGYSAMFSTGTLASAKVKNVKNADTTSTWAYLMISIKPEWTSK
jgi:hypothetical protein